MKIQIVSDIHINFPRNYATYKDRIQNHEGADVLVLAGDTLDGSFYFGTGSTDGRCPMKDRFIEAMNYFHANWKHVVVCWGNHDFWGGILPSNYHGHVNDIGDVRFVCTPLFSDIRGMRKDEAISFVDFRAIKRDISHMIRFDDYNAYHAACVRWLEDRLTEETDKKIVVVTHHLPSFRCVSMQYLGNPLNRLFANNMDEFIKQYSSTIKCWIHGHSHDGLNIEIEGVPVVRNPLGYLDYNEGFEFNPSKIIEL